MKPIRLQNFERLLNPRHIAFFGGADAAVAICEARRMSYRGEIWPVNPKRDKLEGVPCYADIDELPGAPDAAFLAIPADSVPATAARLAAKGTAGIVCYSAGFGEIGRAGRKIEQQLLRDLGDTILIGPNCYGLLNYLDRVALWPFAHGGTCPGYGAAIITQSGMMSANISMNQRSLPLTHMISGGNQAGLEVAELIELLCPKAEVRAIGLHIEGIRDIAAFERAALLALKSDTPIVALKTGHSVIGEQLAMSHTGSLAGTRQAYQALFARTGIIEVSNPTQLMETLKFLCIAGAPAGNRVLSFTCSGGDASMLADYAEDNDLVFPEFSTTARRALKKILPSIATVTNPLDYTTMIWGQPENTGPVFATACARLQADVALLVQDYPVSGLDESRPLYLKDGIAFAEATREAGLPGAICASISENMDLATRTELISRGIAPMQGLHEALNAIRQATRWRQAQQFILNAPPAPLRPRRKSQTRVLQSEADAKGWLQKAGLAVPEGRLASEAELEAAAIAIDGPKVLKMTGPKLAHKTEAGAVVLNLTSVASVLAAAARIRESVTRHDPEAVTHQFLIEAMEPAPLAELVVAVRRDPQFGMLMTLGSGGVFVELVGDTRTLLLPAFSNVIAAELARRFVSFPFCRVSGAGLRWTRKPCLTPCRRLPIAPCRTITSPKSKSILSLCMQTVLSPLMHCCMYTKRNQPAAANKSLLPCPQLHAGTAADRPGFLVRNDTWP